VGVPVRVLTLVLGRDFLFSFLCDFSANIVFFCEQTWTEGKGELRWAKDSYTCIETLPGKP